MALPISPAPPSDDIAQRGWSAITIRIAWTLLSVGVKVRPDVLRDARQHAILHLAPSEALTHAEDISEACTRRLVQRARTGADTDPWPQDWAMPVSSRWRRALERSLTPLSRAILQHHYADNRPLPRLAERMELDLIALEASRGGLREIVRRAGSVDGLPLDRWEPARLDRLLGRLAAFSAAVCPPLIDVLDGAHRTHVAGCTRCDRARRLIRRGVLTLEDLVPPSLGARPAGRVTALAVQFHPDGRRHRDAIVAELPTRAFSIGADTLIMDVGTAGAEVVDRTLVLAAELGMPRREFLRGAVVEGPGSWSRLGLLGPLTRDALQESALRPWGVVDRLGELPARLPEPPSARGLWLGVMALAALLLILLRTTVFAPVAIATPYGLEVEFVSGRYGHWASFDVADSALLTVIEQSDDGPQVLLSSQSTSDKADFALGDGSYRVHSGGRLLVAAHADTLAMDALLEASRDADNPLAAIATHLRNSGAFATVDSSR
ncbi:MAG: hypothetical protein ACI8PZ_001956 [Myxococcota bacterium]|jgi:hypothetical protein